MYKLKCEKLEFQIAWYFHEMWICIFIIIGSFFLFLMILTEAWRGWKGRRAWYTSDMLVMGEIDSRDFAAQHLHQLLHLLRVTLHVHEDLVLGAAAQRLPRLDVHDIYTQILSATEKHLSLLDIFGFNAFIDTKYFYSYIQSINWWVTSKWC